MSFGPEKKLSSINSLLVECPLLIASSCKHFVSRSDPEISTVKKTKTPTNKEDCLPLNL